MSAYGNDKSLFEEATERVRLQRETNHRTIIDLMLRDMLDENGYPTEAALTIIELWDFEDVVGWFDFIQGLWHHRTWGWHEDVANHEWKKNTDVYRYDISTAGWSGNESLIRAMESNIMLWAMTWYRSQRGGHYIFEREI